MDQFAIRQRHQARTGEDHDLGDTVMLEEHEQLKIISELKQQAFNDCNQQRKALTGICILFAGISMYLSEFHGVHVNLFLRLSSATIHIFCGLLLVEDEKQSRPFNLGFEVTLVTMIGIQAIHFSYVYYSFSKNDSHIPMLLLIGNVCTFLISRTFKRDTIAAKASIQELEGLRYNFKSV